MQMHKMEWSDNIANEINLTEEEILKLASLLVDYNQYFDPAFTHVSHSYYSILYLKGLLSNLDRKNIERIALNFGKENDIRCLQNYFKTGKWDEEIMHSLYLKRFSEKVACENSMITIDDSGDIKKGKDSVAVASQYCGNVGKTANCQVGVHIGYTSEKGYGLLKGQLFMPERWFTDEYAERREKCQVPEDLEFRKKTDIALSLLQEIEETNLFPAKWIGIDCFYGASHEFIDNIPDKYYYLASVPKDTKVWLEMPEVGLPPYKGVGRYPEKERAFTDPINVSKIAKDPSLKWELTYLGEGSKGPIMAKTACIRVVDSRDELPGKEVWLYIRKMNNKNSYFLSNAPKDIAREELNRAVLMRWPIEQSFHDGKDTLGMKDNQSRSWQGWHRHILYVYLAMLFLFEVLHIFTKNGEPILTIPQAKILVVAGLNLNNPSVEKAAEIVKYYMKRSNAAYLSHKKKKELEHEKMNM